MRPGFEGRRHHVEYGPLLATKYLLRYLECRLRRLARQIEHFRLSISMMLDQLIGAVAMVMIHAAVRRQNEFHVEILNFQLRSDEISQRVGSRHVRIDSDVWR